MIFETVLGILTSIALGIYIVNIIVLDAHISIDELRERIEEIEHERREDHNTTGIS